MDGYEYICVLNFEATCDNIKYYDNEIIEFPSILLKWNGINYEPISEFQKFCKPLVRPFISEYCHRLTGITQAQIDNASNFADVLIDHNNWLIENTGGNVIILTCGHWDLGTMMVNECIKWSILPSEFYFKYVNIKKEFNIFYKTNRLYDMAPMLDKLNIKLEDRHDSGIDDCRNISKILIRMVHDGFIINKDSIVNINNDLYKINNKKENPIEWGKFRSERLYHSKNY